MNDTNTTYDTAVRDADFDDFADSATAVTSDASDADEIATTLAQWWQTNARDLPWRFGRTTPWGVLVSEVMSQQTQMGRVVPYWTAWMDRWPDAAALADAPKSDVITAWGAAWLSAARPAIAGMRVRHRIRLRRRAAAYVRRIACSARHR